MDLEVGDIVVGHPSGGKTSRMIVWEIGSIHWNRDRKSKEIHVWKPWNGTFGTWYEHNLELVDRIEGVQLYARRDAAEVKLKLDEEFNN